MISNFHFLETEFFFLSDLLSLLLYQLEDFLIKSRTIWTDAE
jgi:hypothetical protein